MSQKQISPVMIASKIVAHGIVNGHVVNGKFSLKGLPFTIYLRPKSSTSNIDEVMKAQLFNEDAASSGDYPLTWAFGGKLYALTSDGLKSMCI